MQIRNETQEDVFAIEAVTTAAFLNAPHTSHTEQFIVAALRAAGALSVSLVAEAEGAIVGHVAVSPVTISDGTPDWYGLGPISVLPAWQGQGVGSALMRAASRGQFASWGRRGAWWWGSRLTTGGLGSRLSRGWCFRTCRRSSS